jgi:hypothetical protein
MSFINTGSHGGRPSMPNLIHRRTPQDCTPPMSLLVRHLRVACPSALHADACTAERAFAEFVVDIELRGGGAAAVDLASAVEQCHFVLATLPFTELGALHLALARAALLPSAHFEAALASSIALTVWSRRRAGGGAGDGAAAADGSGVWHRSSSAFDADSLARAATAVAITNTCTFPAGPGPHETNAWGDVDILMETHASGRRRRAAGLYRLHIAPGAFEYAAIFADTTWLLIHILSFRYNNMPFGAYLLRRLHSTAHPSHHA